MEDFLAKSQRFTSFAAILLLGIGIGIVLTSEQHWNDSLGLLSIGLALFFAGGSCAFYSARKKLHQETV